MLSSSKFFEAASLCVSRKCNGLSDSFLKFECCSYSLYQQKTYSQSTTASVTAIFCRGPRMNSPNCIIRSNMLVNKMCVSVARFGLRVFHRIFSSPPFCIFSCYSSYVIFDYALRTGFKTIEKIS